MANCDVKRTDPVKSIQRSEIHRAGRRRWKESSNFDDDVRTYVRDLSNSNSMRETSPMSVSLIPFFIQIVPLFALEPFSYRIQQKFPGYSESLKLSQANSSQICQLTSLARENCRSCQKRPTCSCGDLRRANRRICCDILNLSCTCDVMAKLVFFGLTGATPFVKTHSPMHFLLNGNIQRKIVSRKVLESKLSESGYRVVLLGMHWDAETDNCGQDHFLALVAFPGLNKEQRVSVVQSYAALGVIGNEHVSFEYSLEEFLTDSNIQFPAYVEPLYHALPDAIQRYGLGQSYKVSEFMESVRGLFSTRSRYIHSPGGAQARSFMQLTGCSLTKREISNRRIKSIAVYNEAEFASDSTIRSDELDSRRIGGISLFSSLLTLSTRRECGHDNPTSYTANISRKWLLTKRWFTLYDEVLISVGSTSVVFAFMKQQVSTKTKSEIPEIRVIYNRNFPGSLYTLTQRSKFIHCLPESLKDVFSQWRHRIVAALNVANSTYFMHCAGRQEIFIVSMKLSQVIYAVDGEKIPVSPGCREAFEAILAL